MTLLTVLVLKFQPLWLGLLDCILFFDDKHELSFAINSMNGFLSWMSSSPSNTAQGLRGDLPTSKSDTHPLLCFDPNGNLLHSQYDSRYIKLSKCLPRLSSNIPQKVYGVSSLNIHNALPPRPPPLSPPPFLLSPHHPCNSVPADLTIEEANEFIQPLGGIKMFLPFLSISI